MHKNTMVTGHQEALTSPAHPRSSDQQIAQQMQINRMLQHQRSEGETLSPDLLQDEHGEIESAHAESSKRYALAGEVDTHAASSRPKIFDNEISTLFEEEEVIIKEAVQSGVLGLGWGAWWEGKGAWARDEEFEREFEKIRRRVEGRKKRVGLKMVPETRKEMLRATEKQTGAETETNRKRERETKMDTEVETQRECTREREI